MARGRSPSRVSSPPAGDGGAFAVVVGRAVRERLAMTTHPALSLWRPSRRRCRTRRSSAATVWSSASARHVRRGGALRGVDVAFTGELHGDHGPIGSGKSTLLHILAGLDRPTEVVEIAGTRLDRLNDRDLTLLRRREVGFVFQSYNLLPVLTAEENITLPLRIGGARRSRGGRHVPADSVGLGDRRTHRRRIVRRPAAVGRGRVRPDHASGRGVRRRAGPETSTPGQAARSSASCAARSTTSGRRS